jgi:hypothetical protein
VLNHPRYRLHIVTSRGRHVLAREHGLRTPLGYAGAFFTNAVRRKAMGAWLERVVFSSGGAALPFATQDYRTRQNRADRGQLHARAAGQLLHPVCAARGARHPRRAARRLLGRRHHRLPPAPGLP